MLLLHDAGASASSLEPFGAALAPGACLLSPRGTVRDGPRGVCFFRRDERGAPHTVDLVSSTDSVLSLLRVATPAYGLTPGRVIAVGFAHGATLGASLLLRFPQALAGAVLWRPAGIAVPRDGADLRGRPVFVSGDAERTGVAGASGWVQCLTQAGASVTAVPERGGHCLSLVELAEARVWLLSNFPTLVSA
jgi:predicted esterase